MSLNPDALRQPPPLIYDPPDEPLNILHVDEDLLVLSKPSGLLSVPGKQYADCLEARARTEFPQCLSVHRLDMDTSGVFVMAMSKEAQANLGKQFERRKIDKTYVARVWGEPKDNEGLVDLPLRCDWERRPMQIVCHEHGRPSQTHWRVLRRIDNECRVELKPITGRSHQLRVHMDVLGHPILGDPFYGHEEARKATPRLMLHAQSITLHHPKDGARVCFVDSAPF